MLGRALAEGQKSYWQEIIESLVIAVILAVVIRAFILQPFYIPSGSMIPTLLQGDRILVAKFAYWFKDPQRGDIIVFHYPLNPRKDYIKRVIGVGGDVVELRDNHLYINGHLTPEPYLPPGTVFPDYGPVKVPPGCYFVLGDNRMNSEDSRVWGMLERRYIIGKAIFRYWPLDRIGVLN
ncbi:signal peptidase I [Ammonifex thiophilus]|uniref:signal peptidase I n=1 Tax=Ammonifex thiophilus TaxID=444093 RepID=UPI001F0C6D6E|nr:signal peptidase I [Ammonifex thiophilus]